METAFNEDNNNPFLIDQAVSDDGFSAFNMNRFMAYLKQYRGQDVSNAAEQIAEGFVSRGNQQHGEEMATNIKRQTGIDIRDMLLGNNGVAEKTEQIAAANALLIKSVQSQYLDKVQTAVTQGLVSGAMPKDIAAQIKGIGGITEKRAKFIARDQTAKLNGALTQARHEALGITHYRWVTSGDERVRDSHADNDGQIFEWANPPQTGHPGQDFNCRCTAIAVLDVAKEKQEAEIEQVKNATAPDNYDFHTRELAKNEAAITFIKQYKLDKNEGVSVRDYTANGYQKLNSGLRKGKLTPKITVFANVLNRALNKLPKFSGTVYREVNLPAHVLATYLIGAIVIEKGFTSSSYTDFQSTTPHKLIIKSKNGRVIEKISAMNIENEVLFKSNTAFNVTKRYMKNGILIIELSEK